MLLICDLIGDFGRVEGSDASALDARARSGLRLWWGGGC